jgi:hypothetical protein
MRRISMNDSTEVRSVFSRSATLASALVLMASCSSTRIEGSWIDPSLRGHRLADPVLVVGAMGDETTRRLFEDAMATTLAAHGLRAIKSYDAIGTPLDADSDEPLLAATRKSGARYLLSSAVIGYTRKTYVEAGPLPYLGAPVVRHRGAYGAWYGQSYRSWGAFAATSTTVRQVDVFTVETVLVNAESDRIEWSVRTKSAAGTKLDQDVNDLTRALTGAMGDAGLVTPGN